jgi:hypothetical protein
MIAFVWLNRDSEEVKMTKAIITYIILRGESHDHGENIIYALMDIRAEENFVSQR